MTILFAESTFWTDNLAFREKYAKVIRTAYADAKKLLPKIPEELTFINYVAPWESMEEYGQGGYTRNSRLILIAVDDSLPYGEEKLLEFTRQTVFHELNHAVRYEKGLYHKTVLEQGVLEGLATAFERDYADAVPPYGDYADEDVVDWLAEIQAGEVDHYEYMFRHPDGRRWIGYKVGTYLIDQAMSKSGKSILELTSLAPKTILQLAGVTSGPQQNQ